MSLLFHWIDFFDLKVKDQTTTADTAITGFHQTMNYMSICFWIKLPEDLTQLQGILSYHNKDESQEMLKIEIRQSIRPELVNIRYIVYPR